MSYKLMGAAALTGTAGATGLVVANKEKIFGKSRTLSDDLKDKGYRLVSGVSDIAKRNAVLAEKLKGYQAESNSSHEFKGKPKSSMTADTLLSSCRGLEKSSDYEDVLSTFKRWCVLDFKDVLVTVGERTVITDTGTDGTNWKQSLNTHRAQMKSVIEGVTDATSDNDQWKKVKSWCDGRLSVHYSNDSKEDFDRAEKWCLSAN
ncbi:hypothetical protein HF1_05600 [Mycoplasma haemofelis str. Langford 1]|uniref:Uncharacterized protein n=1 Tax=Mycoplasma haemofelis (strain Langford 1) TaxID=941640 RepID=E8ZHE7_MYCHL|nr:hypothetical protein [Mycoplasma haemofelis]CBY92568.1 hypothetical protein HF1_05600 [Mycoplasma haemofelis str. Langford 1]